MRHYIMSFARRARGARRRSILARNGGALEMEATLTRGGGAYMNGVRGCEAGVLYNGMLADVRPVALSSIPGYSNDRRMSICT
jgi:hypothetical protein